MSYVNILPAEIWFIIFEMITAPSLEAKALCNPLTCPDLNTHLRLRWDYGPPCSKTRQNLRLVCRTFNALLGSSIPVHHIMKDLDTPIPPRSKAVYIKESEDVGLHLERLLMEPLICGQLITLALPINPRGHLVQAHFFETLCGISHALCNLRNLTLGLFRTTLMGQGSIKEFWSRLNSSFPHLVCLVLRGMILSVAEISVVVFEKLEVLDLDSPGPGDNILFPALRHAACTHISQMGMWKHNLSEPLFTEWPRMESLLVREGTSKWRIGWNDLPQLRLLATTREVLLGFPPLPPQHPLQHIYVDIGPLRSNHSLHIPENTGKSEELRLIKQINKLFPTIALLTLRVSMRKKGGKEDMMEDFDADALAIIGFAVNHSASRAYRGGRHIVLERIQATSRSERLRAGWSNFRNAAFQSFPALSITSTVGK